MTLFALALVLSDPAQLPRDVRRFVDRYNACLHFSGEEPYDAERAAFLEKAITRFCSGLSRTRKRLIARHARNAAVQAVLAERQEELE